MYDTVNVVVVVMENARHICNIETASDGRLDKLNLKCVIASCMYRQIAMVAVTHLCHLWRPETTSICLIDLLLQPKTTPAHLSLLMLGTPNWKSTQSLVQ
jgi:hypothetical protein